MNFYSIGTATTSNLTASVYSYTVEGGINRLILECNNPDNSDFLYYTVNGSNPASSTSPRYELHRFKFPTMVDVVKGQVLKFVRNGSSGTNPSIKIQPGVSRFSTPGKPSVYDGSNGVDRNTQNFMVASKVRPLSDFWGICGNPINQEGYKESTTENPQGVNFDVQLDMVKDLGCGWYRFSITEGDVGPTANIETSSENENLKKIDKILELADSRGIKILAVLIPSTFSKDLAVSQTASIDFRSKVYREAKEFAQKIGKRFENRINYFEMSNELDNVAMLRQGEWYWEPGVTPPSNAPSGTNKQVSAGLGGAQTYHYQNDRYSFACDEIHGLADGIKSGNVDSYRILNIAGWEHYGFSDRLFAESGTQNRTLVEGNPTTTAIDYTLKPKLEGFAQHWYSENGDMENIRDSDYNVLQHCYNYGLPLWITELNFRNTETSKHDKGYLINTTHEDQDVSMVKFIQDYSLKYKNDPRIYAFFVYELLNGSWHSGTPTTENYCGLIEIERANQTTNPPSGPWVVKKKRPAYYAYQEICRFT